MEILCVMRCGNSSLRGPLPLFVIARPRKEAWQSLFCAPSFSIRTAPGHQRLPSRFAPRNDSGENRLLAMTLGEGPPFRVPSLRASVRRRGNPSFSLPNTPWVPEIATSGQNAPFLAMTWREDHPSGCRHCEP